jgi:hypothetical protein
LLPFTQTLVHDEPRGTSHFANTNLNALIDRLTGEVLAQVEVLLQGYTAHHLERNLKSVEFLHELKTRALPTSGWNKGRQLRSSRG